MGLVGAMKRSYWVVQERESGLLTGFGNITKYRFVYTSGKLSDEAYN